jgi:hypothetical protein
VEVLAVGSPVGMVLYDGLQAIETTRLGALICVQELLIWFPPSSGRTKSGVSYPLCDFSIRDAYLKTRKPGSKKRHRQLYVPRRRIMEVETSRTVLRKRS